MAGLREQKKQATRQALREAALRLALERGPDDVRVDDIAEAAGVSPRTYNNYFASREQAIVAAVTAEREIRVAQAVAARPPSARLAEAVIDAVVEQYADPGEQHAAALLMITTRPALREAFVAAPASMELPPPGRGDRPPCGRRGHRQGPGGRRGRRRPGRSRPLGGRHVGGRSRRAVRLAPRSAPRRPRTPRPGPGRGRTPGGAIGDLGRREPLTVSYKT
ncbi:helix-turn-helix domain-containing protein [Nonomuraea salmonea]|uniref:TetR/AcrR family transcriptional regulator n=1 Tax=Nonomuraea salmonea TaxID=46181 RepID=UPI0031EA8B1E